MKSNSRLFDIPSTCLFLLLLALMSLVGMWQTATVISAEEKTGECMEMSVQVSYLSIKYLEELRDALGHISTARLGTKGSKKASVKTSAVLKTLDSRLSKIEQEMKQNRDDLLMETPECMTGLLVCLLKLQRDKENLTTLRDDLQNPTDARIEAIKLEIAAFEKNPLPAEIKDSFALLSEILTSRYGEKIRMLNCGNGKIRIQQLCTEGDILSEIKNAIDSSNILQFRLVRQMSQEDNNNAEHGILLEGYDLMNDEKGESLYIEKTVLLSCDDVASAQVTSPRNGIWNVDMQFSEDGARKFAVVTKDCIGRRLAIILEGKILLAPTIFSEITDGKAAITGSFTKDRAEEIAEKTNATGIVRIDAFEIQKGELE